MKKCLKCGAENADESVFCAGCGATLDQPAPAPAPAPSAYDAPAYTAPAAAPVEKNKATLWLILNIVSTVVCCPGSFIFSVLGIVFAAMGMSSFNKGNYEDMSKKAKLSMIFFIISLVVGLIVAIVFAALGVFSAYLGNNY